MDFFSLSHRAIAAFLATVFRCSGVIFFRRAFAPSFPSATAAEFFLFAIYDMLSVRQKLCNLPLKCSALGIYTDR